MYAIRSYYGYGPLFGLTIAFKDYNVFQGIFGSEWVGLKHFVKFFSSDDFLLLFKNTLTLGFFTLIFGFPIPILLAISLNELRVKWLKKSIQTLTYFRITSYNVCYTKLLRYTEKLRLMKTLYLRGVNPHPTI